LGSCCSCGGFRNVQTVIMLDKRASVEGTGCWACFQCNLPPAGAVAVVCDDCFDKKVAPKFACIGVPGDNARLPIELLTVPFEHDMTKHPGEVF